MTWAQVEGSESEDEEGGDYNGAGAGPYSPIKRLSSGNIPETIPE